MNKIAISVLFLLALLLTTPSIHASEIPSECMYLDRVMGLNSKNNKSSDVKKLQAFLREKGYFNLEPTGYFGLITQGAVKRYQAANGISPVSGFVGPLTLASIYKVCVAEASW